MPFGLDTHFLTVDANAIYKVNTGDLTNLYSMLTGKLILYTLTSHVLICQSSLDVETLLNMDED